ncbi:MAG TPA: acyl carrier protein [Verrucomicrobiae bacterium]
MGLDLVELVMSVEERFGITLSDAEAEQAVTPAKLIDIVVAKVQTNEPAVCMTSHVFYSVRRALMNEFSLPRARVVPAAQLDDLIPRVSRQAAWTRLHTALGAQVWPELKRPWWVVLALGILGGAVLLQAVAFHLMGFSLVLGLVAGLLVWSAAIVLTKPLGVEFSRNHATVGQLAEFLVAFAPGGRAGPSGRWSRPDVAAAIRELTIEQLGLKPGVYREDARFIQDLGGS